MPDYFFLALSTIQKNKIIKKIIYWQKVAMDLILSQKVLSKI
jgi:hypothetical protein